MKKVEETEILSTQQQLEDFLKSCVWTDIQNSIEMRIEQLRDELEIAGPLDLIRVLQAQVSNLRGLSGIVESLLAAKMIDNQNEKRDG